MKVKLKSRRVIKIKLARGDDRFGMGGCTLLGMCGRLVECRRAVRHSLDPKIDVVYYPDDWCVPKHWIGKVVRKR